MTEKYRNKQTKTTTMAVFYKENIYRYVKKNEIGKYKKIQKNKSNMTPNGNIPQIEKKLHTYFTVFYFYWN